MNFSSNVENNTFCTRIISRNYTALFSNPNMEAGQTKTDKETGLQNRSCDKKSHEKHVRLIIDQILALYDVQSHYQYDQKWWPLKLHATRISRERVAALKSQPYPMVLRRSTINIDITVKLLSDWPLCFICISTNVTGVGGLPCAPSGLTALKYK